MISIVSANWTVNLSAGPKNNWHTYLIVILYIFYNFLEKSWFERANYLSTNSCHCHNQFGDYFFQIFCLVWAPSKLEVSLEGDLQKVRGQIFSQNQTSYQTHNNVKSNLEGHFSHKFLVRLYHFKFYISILTSSWQTHTKTDKKF